MNLNWKCESWSELSKETLYDILRLRVEVFVVEQDCPYPELDDKDQGSMHLYAVDDSKLAAYIRILPAGQSYAEVSIGRVVIDVDYRGTGLGYDLMERGLSWIEENWGRVPIRIGAQEHLEAYYSKLKFSRDSEMYLEDGIPHIEMIFKP